MNGIRLAALILPVLAAGAQTRDPFRVTGALKPAADRGAEVSITLSMPAGHYLYADRVKIEPLDGAAWQPLSTPEPKPKFDPSTESTVGVYENEAVFRFRLDPAPPAAVGVRVQYQGCDENLCFLPATTTLSLSAAGAAPAAGGPGRAPLPEAAAPAGWEAQAARFTLAGRAAGYLPPRRFLDFLDQAEAGGGPDRNPLREAMEKRGILFAIALVLAGGLALNLTPCVLPMIPINIAIIGAGAGGTSRARGFVLGAVYGAGIALAYGALGLAVVLTGSKFGALNASPAFNLAVAAVFAVLALAMFDVIHVDFSRLQGRVDTRRAPRGRFATAFALGGLAALLAGACVAPVVIWVLLLSTDLYAAGHGAALAFPFLLGLGMALPWPFAGAGLSFLPKPGRWMERVKAAFGVIILAGAAWYGVQGWSLWRDAAAGAGGAGPGETPAAGAEGWMTALPEALAAAEAQRKPLLIDFWASWCKNCHRMDKTTFKDPRVVRRLDGYVKLKYRAEDPAEPRTRAVLDHFGALGLPTYLVLTPPQAGR